MTELLKDNPFYSNHVFTQFDLNRVEIDKWTKRLLFFLPTYFQLADGYVFFYKRWFSRYFLISTEVFSGRPEHGTQEKVS